jgi:hypothetical protein
LTPRIVIVVELERVPIAIIDAANETEERRLLDWLEAHPDYPVIIRLAFLSALDLMRGERAA